MNFLSAAIHATLDARTGISTARDYDEARYRAYASRVMADKFATRSTICAQAYAERAYWARTKVWR